MKHLLLILLICLLPALACADERILSYHSRIFVEPDGSLDVLEQIRVRSEQQEIRQGIYRDFPTDYRDRFGNRYRVEFTVIEVRRDGATEGFFTQREGNGVRVYMGRKGSYLPAGEYTYELRYRTDRQLGFFIDHDELYWNVTGNDWAFPIDTVSAEVMLPPALPLDMVRIEGYTGFSGDQGQDYRGELTHEGAVAFTTTRPLATGEGLTIVVSWPKGYIAEPTLGEQSGYLLRDNRVWLVALIGLALCLGYYLIAWRRVGRDPDAGVIIPRYEPPKGFSPASSRFIREMGYDDKTFSTALVNLAVKGLLNIREDDQGFVLERTAQPAKELAAGEKVLLKQLFPGTLRGSSHQVHGPLASLRITQKNHKKLRMAIESHKESLKNDFEKHYFLTNRSWLLPGLVLTLFTYALSVLSIENPEKMAIGGFLSLWLTGWTAAVVMLGRKVIAAWRGARDVFGIFPALFISAFSVPFFASEIFVFFLLGSQVSPALPVILLCALGLNALFYQLLKAPTQAGRRLLDLLEGFRLYLDVAERDELNLRHPPEKTAELFEKYLPFALALDVEQRWTERFSKVFGRIGEQESGYHPTWYHGSSWHPGALGTFAGSIGGALSSAIGAGATAPGSSSGSGGGGSSGGGGGGGGGGGW